MNEINQWNPEVDVYYRVYTGKDGAPIVVCMQWFDEWDYDEKRFLDPRRFETETEAEQVAIALNTTPHVLADEINALRARVTALEAQLRNEATDDRP